MTGLAKCTMSPVQKPPDCRSVVVSNRVTRWWTGKEKEPEGDRGVGRRWKCLSDSQEIVSRPFWLMGELTDTHKQTGWLQPRSIPCWTLSAPSSSSCGDTRISTSLSINSSSRKVTVAVHTETATIVSACTPKNLQGPPLKIPTRNSWNSLERLSSTMSFSANRATAKSPQTEAKRWMGTQPTGSSIRSRSRREHPGHAIRAPTAPMRIPSQGRATVHIASNWISKKLINFRPSNQIHCYISIFN